MSCPFLASGLAAYLHLPETPTNIIMEDIEFSTYSIEGETRSLKLDLYQPKQAQPEPLPVILYIHGGGWEENKKKDCPGELISSYGYTVICPTHRYSYEASFPAQIHDIKAAVRWVRAKAYIYDFDSDRIGVIGEASGGHLSALLGTSGGVEALEGEQGHEEFSSEVQAVVNWSGPTDFAQIPLAFEGDPSPKEYKQLQDLPWAHLTRITTRLLGGPIPEHPEKVDLANPINFVTPDDPPFLIAHDEKDKWIPVSQSEILVEALQSWEVDVDFHREAARAHQLMGETINPVVLGKTMSFFYQHLKYEREHGTTESQDYLQAYEQMKQESKRTDP
ncbi:MAG: alpha/beta hydrolase [Cyanobacteria bacterium J06621_11]